MKDGEDKETTKSRAVRNNLLTTANIPYSIENKPDHESLGVIVQQHWQHPERPIGGITGSTSKAGLHIASSPPDPPLRASLTNTSSFAANRKTKEKIVTIGKEVTMQEGQAETKPRRPKKQPDKQQELGKKRQRICQDEIALHQRHEQDQQMIDY